MHRPKTAIAVLVLAVTLGACATVQEQAYDLAEKLVAKVCGQPEDVRLVERTRLWEAFGLNTTQVCVPKDQRVKPPTIP